ncbi:DEAD/DEAH box helicase [Salisediminibacterium beveridgei]|uniref:ATP-dependent RNA helicase YfmL n=1 Tax=Salisediminibacterium beveridgei TaxID=632773 RepID=A0A1D7QWF8_9BACI|nr:DEAD/DEAH box helicase [Salisediminibacterium beveridgei]AOM83344.1 ATP-dependent RNA helicase YfmL [Salisediminibacterium beveridgei]
MDTLLESLPEWIQKQWKKEDFKDWTPVQQEMVPAALKGNSLIAEAPTGTGKTLGYLIPGMNKIDPSSKNVQLLIIVPGKELAMQVHEEVGKWSTGSSIHSAVMIGGANVKRQYEKLKKKPQVITGTPGRISELIQDKKLKVHEVQTLVFDEADQLFVPDHLATLDLIQKAVPKNEQRIICSATVPDRVMHLAEERIDNLVEIRVNQSMKQIESMTHVFLVSEKRDKVKMLGKLTHMHGFLGMAFLNNSFDVDKVTEKLTYNGIQATGLHGDKGKQGRELAMKDFREQKANLLITTDLASRGLDVKGVSHVIHFDLANDQKQYLHRAGRTARAGESGTVVSIVTEGELVRLKQIAEELKLNLKEASLYFGELMVQDE